MNFPMNIENWRLIDGYDNYEVSSHGRVRNNKTSYIMQQRTDDKGYRGIDLHKDGERKTHRVHRLVAFAFLNKNDEHTQVDHLDHDRSNNMLDNLRWVTQSINLRNASRRIDNTSGTKGVSFNKRYNASWCDDEKRKFKSFNVQIYGDVEAKQMAINYRRDKAIENDYINV